MFTPRIFVPIGLQVNQQIELDKSASHHLSTVMRLRTGASLRVFNGMGGEYSARLLSVNKKIARIEISEFFAVNRESPLTIHLAQGISRGERMDFTIQKAVELGVNRITPVFSQQCQVKFDKERIEKRWQHWQRIAMSASEQSGRCVVPSIEHPCQFSAWLKSATGLRLICHPEQSEKINSAEISNTPLDYKQEIISLLVGPESGFSDDEISQALVAGFHSLVLGPRILRTETAALVALSVLQSRWGDIGSILFLTTAINSPT